MSNDAFKRMKFSFTVSDVNLNIFQIVRFYTWASWNCFGENIFKISPPVSFDARGLCTLNIQPVHFPNRLFDDEDRMYIRTIILIQGKPTDHAFASFLLSKLKDGPVVKPFKDHHGIKGKVIKYGKVSCTMLNAASCVPHMRFSEEQHMGRKEFRRFLMRLTDKERTYFDRFPRLNGIVERVIYDQYPKISFDFPAQVFPQLKQVPIDHTVVRGLLEKALEVYGMSESDFIKCINSVGKTATITCCEMLALNVFILASQFHGLGLEYRPDINVDPSSGRIFGIDRQGEGDDDFGLADCENSNSTPREFFIGLSMLDDAVVNADELIRSVRDLLSYYYTVNLSANATTDSLSHIDEDGHGEEDDKINGHITTLLTPQADVLRNHNNPDLPSFDDYEERFAQLQQKKPRNYLPKLWVETTAPQGPVFDPKPVVMGTESAQQCLADMTEVTTLMMSDDVFSPLIAPVEQSKRTLDGTSPNHFLKFISTGCIASFYEPYNKSLRQCAIRPFLKRINNVTKDEEFVFGATMEDLIAHEEYWVPLPAFSEDEMALLDYYIHHIPRIERFHFVESKRVATIDFLHSRGKADCSSFYCMPLSARLLDVDNATLRKIDQALLLNSTIEFFKWTIVEMGDESLIFLNVRPVARKRRMLELQHQLQHDILKKPSDLCRLLGMKNYKQGEQLRSVMEFSVGGTTYAVRFQAEDEERHLVSSFIKQYAAPGVALKVHLSFEADGMHILPSAKNAVPFVVTSINNISLLKYNAPRSVGFGADLKQYLLHVNTHHIDSDSVDPDDKDVDSFQFHGSSHNFRVKLESGDKTAHSFKQRGEPIGTMVIQQHESLDYWNDLYTVSVECADRIIENDQVRFFFFRSYESLYAFIPASFKTSVVNTQLDRKNGKMRFYFLADNKMAVMIVSVEHWSAAFGESTKVLSLSAESDGLHVNAKTEQLIVLKEGARFQININSIPVQEWFNSSFITVVSATVQNTIFPRQLGKEGNGMIILRSEIPAVIERYFDMLHNDTPWAYVGEFGDNWVFVTNRVIDPEEEIMEFCHFAFARNTLLAPAAMVPYDIHLHDNMIYIGGQQSAHFAIPPYVLFLKSTVQMPLPKLQEMLTPFMKVREKILKKDFMVDLQCSMVSLSVALSFNEAYFVLYDCKVQVLIIIFYYEQEQRWVIHRVNLNLEEAGASQFSEEQCVLSIPLPSFKKIQSDSSYQISIVTLLQCFRDWMNMNERTMIFILYDLLAFIALKVPSISSVHASNAVSIYFYHVSLLLENNIFLGESQLKDWWYDSSSGMVSKLNYLFQLVLTSPRSAFSIYPVDAVEYFSIELRNVAACNQKKEIKV